MDEPEINKAIREALASFRAGHLVRAEAIYRRLVTEAPDARKWSDLGVILKALGRHDDAIAAYRRALALSPAEFTPHYNLANLLRDRGQKADAEASYLQAIALAPDFADARINLGRLLLEQGKVDEALSQLTKAVAASPDSYHAHNNLGVALARATRFDEAITSYRRAIEIKPDAAEAHSNLGSASLTLGRLDDAIASCLKAAEVDPGFADGHYNLGNCYWMAYRPEDAIEPYERALALAPGNAQYHWNLSLVLLLSGDFARGWPQYEWRWLTKDYTPMRYGFTPWAGQRTAGGRLLLWREQGLGDELIYSSMVPELAAAGMSVTLEVDARLVTLMQRSFPGVRVVAQEGPPADREAYDWQCPLDSLGLSLRPSFDSFPRHTGYLKPDAERVIALSRRLRATGAQRVVGVSWRSANHKVGAAKSTALADWSEILRVPGARFVDLQYGDTREEREALHREGIEVEHLDDIDLYNDLEGLAALCAACDLVITASNVTAHMAGALGKPVWLLAPAGRGRIWYWLHGRSDSPWYPSMRIYSQERPGSWQEALSEVALDLVKFANDRR
jgi:Flp pilus assembly protein TadD